MAFYRPLLGVTIAPNLVPWVLKRTFLLGMGKNDIYLGDASKQNVLLFLKFALKKCTHGLMSRIGSDSIPCIEQPQKENS